MEPSQILQRLSLLHPKIIDLSLHRLEILLKTLGNPELKLPPIIHVAGTNGKGSTVAMLAAIQRAAGRCLHIYTSPHLVDFTERIVVANSEISTKSFENILYECEVANRGKQITLFEITTAAAFLAFSRKTADLCLLEVGLGGRFDATNVVNNPALSIITPISMDHEHYLGNTLEKIAFEKSGVLKPGIPAVIGKQCPAALQVIKARAEEINVPLSIYGENWNVYERKNSLQFESQKSKRIVAQPNLVGKHQAQNAGIALAALDILSNRFRVGSPELNFGLKNVYWPGRLQKLNSGPLTRLLPPNVQLWLDGGHNQSAAKTIVQTLVEWKRINPERSIHIVFGALNNRNPHDFLIYFKGLVSYVRTVTIPGEVNSLSSSDACKAAKASGLDAKAAETVHEAIKEIVLSTEGKRIILICGSLYLAGSILRCNK
ncbi:MAG: bifunctional folylpolyglutamate synthase/dihydrofolate synthase [Rhodospirillaceae bacterium]|nr:bifunctional folylpolyglutamate synthase/dihydrofolate synthase [Rhodospirillaceae bacterium]